MNHESTIERLPWLLNGSLDPAERTEVERHLAGCSSCRAEFAATLAAARLHELAHPPADALVLYAEGGGDAQVRAEIESHAAGCGSCRVELDLACASAALKTASSVVVPSSADTAPVRRVRAPLAQRLRAAAAVLFLAGAGLMALALWRQSRELDGLRREAERTDSTGVRLAAAEARTRELAAELARARAASPESFAGVRLLELLPVAALRGAAPMEEPRLEAGAAPLATLLLPLERPERGDRYRVRLLAFDDRELFAADGLVPDERGALTLLVRTASLPVGRLRVEVAASGAPHRPLATYPFHLVAPKPPLSSRNEASPRP